MKVEFDEEAIVFLRKLDKKTRERIFNKIISAKYSPFRFFVRLAGRKGYKLRIGSYRAIADISNGRIRILLIGHRRNVYDD